MKASFDLSWKPQELTDDCFSLTVFWRKSIKAHRKSHAIVLKEFILEKKEVLPKIV